MFKGQAALPLRLGRQEPLRAVTRARSWRRLPLSAGIVFLLGRRTPAGWSAGLLVRWAAGLAGGTSRQVDPHGVVGVRSTRGQRARRIIVKQSWLWALLLAGWAGVAHADVPPPDGYVEQCTLERQKKAGEDCQTSRPWHGDHDKGKLEWGTKGYTLRCRTNGASVWTEIWCKTLEPAKPSEPATVAVEPAKPPEPKTQPSAPPAAGAADPGATAPQAAPTAPKESKSEGSQGEGESAPRKAKGCSSGGSDAAGAWLLGLALLGALARGRRTRLAV